jgi:Mrp family chromosome partitioning ATPase
MAIAAYGAAIFVAALVAFVIVPATARRGLPPPPPPAPRPDTAALRVALSQATSRALASEAALAQARATLTAAPPEPVLIDTLSPAMRVRRDSLAASVGGLSRLLSRAQEAPLVASWRALGESPQLRSVPRVREIVDSLVAVDRRRSDFGAAGGIDPIFIALTTRAAELGKELQGIAESRLTSLRSELEHLRPVRRMPAPRPAEADTLPLLAARDSARSVVERSERALLRARSILRDLDLEEERERMAAVDASAPPVAMLAAALVLGLALGYAIMLSGEMRRPRVGDPREATAVAGAPLLARIRQHADVPDRARRRADREISPHLDLVSGHYDVLYTALSASSRLVAVVGDHAGVTASVAANLAATAAHRPRTTLVVDLDFETHAISAVLRTRRAPGMTDLLTRRIEWPEAIRAAIVGRDRTVDVLPSGKRSGRGTVQGVVEVLREELTHLTARYEVVIVNAPHSRSGVVPAAAAAVGAVVICVRTGRTGLGALERLARTVRESGGDVVGVVTWEMEDPVPGALSDADREAGRGSPIRTETMELPAAGLPPTGR